MKALKSFALVVAAGLAAVASAVVPLPGDYLYCDYVASSGSQYIDTGIPAQGGLHVEATLSEPKPSAPVYVLGAAKEDKDDSHGTGSGYVVPVGFDAGATTSLRVLCGTGYRPSAAVGFTAKTDISVFLAASGAAEYVISGGHNSDWRKADEKTPMSGDCYGRNLYLFALNESGSASGFSSTTLYSMKIYTGATGLTDGTLARDFVPCQKKDGEVFGLWDTVEGVFYTPASGSLSGKVSDPQPEPPDDPVVEPIDTGATENWPDAVTEKVAVDGSAGGDLGTVVVHGEALAAYLAKDAYMDHGATGSESVERPKPIAVTVGSTTLYYDNLLLGEKKEFTVGNVSGSFTVAATAPRTLAVPVNAEATTFVANVRDLGGWPLVNGGTTKQGLFFRGGNLDAFNAANPGADNILASQLCVRTEIDLRNLNEGTHAGLAGATYVEAPFHGVNEMDPYGWDGAYNQSQIKAVFSALGTEGALPAYIHCSIGRDRTGLIAQLLLQLAGVAEADVYRDYFTSLFASVNGADDDILSGAKVTARIAWLQDGAGGLVSGEVYGDTLAGRTREYLEAIGVTDEELSRITDALTGETPDEIIRRVTFGVTASRADGAFTWTGGSARTTKYWEDAANWGTQDTYPSSAATVNIPKGTWRICAVTDFSADDLTAKLVDFDSSSRTVFSGGRSLVFSGQVANGADNFFNKESGSGFRLEVTGAGTTFSLENTNASYGYRIRDCSDATFLASAGGALTINGAYFGGSGGGTANISGILLEATGVGSVFTFGHNSYAKGIKGSGVVFAATDGGEFVFKTGKTSGACTFAEESSPNCGIRVDNGTFTCKTAIDIGKYADLGQFVTVQGANPLLTATGDITLGGGTGGLALTLKPEATWPADAPRVKSEKTLKVSSAATFKVDLANLTLEPGATATLALLGGSTLTLNVQPTVVNGGAYQFGTTTEGNVLYLAVTNNAEKVLVNPPVIASKPYTGELQVADVAESAQYTVVENKGGTDAGAYPVVLRLTDPSTAWNDEEQTTGDKTLDFVITPAVNKWMVSPTLSKLGWKAGDAAGSVIATPAFGTVTVTYDEGQAEVPTEAGNHTANVSVAEDPNWSALAPVAVPFTIFPATSPEGTDVPVLDRDSNLVVTNTDVPVVFDAGKLTVGTIVEPSLFPNTSTAPANVGETGGRCVWIEKAAVTLLNGAYDFNELELVADGADLTIGDGATLTLGGKGALMPGGFTWIHAAKDVNATVTINVVTGGTLKVDADQFYYDMNTAGYKSVNVNGGDMTIHYPSTINENHDACGFKALSVFNGGTFACDGYFVNARSLSVSDTATFTASDYLTVDNRAEVVLTVPTEGRTEPMISAKKVVFDSTVDIYHSDHKTLTVDLSAVKQPCRIPLIAATDTLEVSESVVRAIAPKGGDVIFETADNTLYANVKIRGFMVIVR